MKFLNGIALAEKHRLWVDVGNETLVVVAMEQCCGQSQSCMKKSVHEARWMDSYVSRFASTLRFVLFHAPYSSTQNPPKLAFQVFIFNSGYF